MDGPEAEGRRQLKIKSEEVANELLILHSSLLTLHSSRATGDTRSPVQIIEAFLDWMHTAIHTSGESIVFGPRSLMAMEESR